MNLNEIKSILDKEGIYSRVVLFSDGSDLSHIEIPLDEDSLEREQSLIIHYQSQIIDPKAESLFCRIQFSVELPFTYHNLAIADTARLILFLNRFSDLPGFEMDEIDQKIIYRHVYLGREEKVDSMYLTSMIGLIMMFIDINSTNIENVASGDKSFESVITNLLSEHNYL
jgi:hypothetical protein